MLLSFRINALTEVHWQIRSADVLERATTVSQYASKPIIDSVSSATCRRVRCVPGPGFVQDQQCCQVHVCFSSEVSSDNWVRSQEDIRVAIKLKIAHNKEFSHRPGTLLLPAHTHDASRGTDNSCLASDRATLEKWAEHKNACPMP
eukprot:2122661-Rhodomonas_salina.7